MNQQQVLGTNPATIKKEVNGGQPRMLEVDARKVRGLTWGYRKEISAYLGCNETTLSSKLNGRLPLKLAQLNQLALALSQIHQREINTVELLREVLAPAGAPQIVIQEPENGPQLPPPESITPLVPQQGK
jgi:transcriptional regulator with XRE-family HTH domain